MTDTTEIDRHFPIPVSGYGNTANYNNPNIVKNSAGYVFEELNHPRGKDLRPRTATSYWAQNQIGAYDFEPADTGEFWIPGRQSYRASHPIPEDGSTGINHEIADLIFLPGKTKDMYAKAFRVFVGCSPELVEVAANSVMQQHGNDAAWDLTCFCEQDTPSTPVEAKPPGVAGRHLVNGVEEDVVCGASQR